MTGIINRVPIGLLDALDMKSRGQTPRELSGQVQAGLDVWPLYTIDLQRAETGTTGALAAVGPVYPITVPNDEIWWVLMHRASTGALGAGQSCAITCHFFSFLRLGGGFFSGPVGEQVSAGVGEICEARADDQYWAGPGDQIGMSLNSLNAGPITFGVRVLYVPFKR